MPILNLSNPSFVSVTQAGRPNSGGTIEVYVADGLFTTLATVYSDQQKTVPLTNPVVLDDAGKAEIWYEVKVDVREKLSTGTIIDDYLNLDPNAADTVAQGFNLVDNGSFETDTLSDGQPDSWTISPYSGSAVAITESVVTDGTKALEFNTAGVATGGGTATSIKFPVTEGSIVSVAFSFYATNATTLNTFQIKWYDQDDALQSTSTVTMPASGSVPTSWTRYFEDITVDAAGTQGEVILTGISSGGSNLTSKAYFDGITITNANLATLTTTQTLTNKTLTSPAITSPTINGQTGYGMVILDTPSLLIDITAAVAKTNYDMSAGTAEAQAAHAAGAVVLILHCYISSADAGNNSDFLYCGSSSSITTGWLYTKCSTTTTAGGVAVNDAEFVTNVDGNGDFWYQAANNTTTMALKVHLVGYYV